MADTYFVNLSVYRRLFISSFLAKKPRPDIFFLFYSDSFLHVRNEVKELDSNKLKSFAKNALLFYQKVRGGGTVKPLS